MCAFCYANLVYFLVIPRFWAVKILRPKEKFSHFHSKHSTSPKISLKREFFAIFPARKKWRLLALHKNNLLMTRVFIIFARIFDVLIY